MSRTSYFIALIILAGIALPLSSSAAERCVFTKTLELGSTGEDVRCLQRFLNAEGYIVASSGVGSVGNETTLYREKTKEAVRRWQIAQGISPATGNFGPLSQARYALSSSTPTPSTPIAPEPQTPTPAPTPSVDGKKNAASKALRDAKAAYDDAYNEYDDAEDDDRKTGSAEDLLEDALEDLFRGYEAFLDEEYAEARKFAEDSMDTSDEAEDEIDEDDSDDRDEDEIAEDLIDQAREDLEDARDEVDEAEDDDRDTNDAEDLLDEAEELIDEAEDAFDDEDYNDVEDLIDEADDLIDEALDEIED